MDTTCLNCGADVPRDAAENLCVKCFFGQMLAGYTPEPAVQPTLPVESLDRVDPAEPSQPGSIAHPGASRSPTKLPRSFDDYELLEEVGRGGMGVVYKARQISLHRDVALKVILAGDFASSDFIQRFNTEAEAAARLDHPHIVPIYEHGKTEERPFFSMKFIEGERLDRALRLDPMTVRKAVTLMAKIARAVHYAHVHGVLHRDVKPANILLDRQGEPYLTDFGLAKLIEPERSMINGRTGSLGGNLTRTLAVLGTPNYIAPEQASGQNRQVTKLADVYSLGAVLFELLTGRPPFSGPTAVETLRAVLEQEPRRPSSLVPGLSRDLDAICLKCLEKEPGRRYPTAAAFADDLERWLRHEPILARPTPVFARAQRWARRHPAMAIVSSLLGLALIAGFTNFFWMRGRVTSQAAESRARLVRMEVARGNRLVAEGDFFGALLWFSEALRLDQAEPRRASAHRYRIASVRRELPELVQMYFHSTRIHVLEFSPDGRHILLAGEDGTAWLRKVTPLATHATLVTASTNAPNAFGPTDPTTPTVWQHGAPVLAGSFSPEGQAVVTIGRRGTNRIWSVRTGELIGAPWGAADFRPPLPAIPPVIAFSPDGSRVLAAYGSRTVVVRNVRTGQVEQRLGHPERVEDAAFSPDGQWIVTACADTCARIWRAGNVGGNGTAATVTLPHEGPVNRAVFSADNQRLITVSNGRFIRVWDWRSGQTLMAPFGGDEQLMDVSFSPNRQRVVTTGADHIARIWDSLNGKELARLPHSSELYQARFIADGAFVATASMDRKISIWESNPGTGSVAIQGTGAASTFRHASLVDCIASSSSSRLFATASRNGVVRVWDFKASHLFSREFSNEPDHRFGASDSPDPLADLLIEPPDPHLRDIEFIFDTQDAPTPDVLTASEDGAVRLWDVAIDGTSREKIPPLQHPGPVNSAVMDPDGHRILTACENGTAHIWNVATGRELIPPLLHSHAVSHAEFSRDGLRVITASADETARIWSATTGQPLLPPLRHKAPVLQASFSPDGRRAVTAGEAWLNGGVLVSAQVWNAETGRPTGAPLAHDDRTYTADFSADGQRLVTASEDGTAKIWNAFTGRLLAPPLRSSAGVQCAIFSPDGQRIATGDGNGTVRLWDSESGEAISPPLPYPVRRSLVQLSFSGDGEKLLIASRSGAAWVRRLRPAAESAEELLLRAQIMSGHRVDPVTGLVPLLPAALSNAWYAWHDGQMPLRLPDREL